MIVGVCTGVFDLLHHGHLAFLRRAGEAVDLLHIAVASDWLTRVQKGPERPKHCESLRLAAVRNAMPKNARAFVTDMLDFRGIESLVDVFILGEDQHNVRWNGSRVVLPRTPGVSTTEIINAYQR